MFYLLRKDFFFTFMGVKLSIVNNYVYVFHNNKLHHFVRLKRAPAFWVNWFLLLCFKEKRSTISLSRGYFSCLLAFRCVHISVCEWKYYIFAISNSVNVLKWECISILLNIFNKKSMTKVNISVKIWNCDLKNNIRTPLNTITHVLAQQW